MTYDISLADFLLLTSITLLLWLVTILRNRIVKLERRVPQISESRKMTKEEAMAHSKVLENRSVIKGKLYDISGE